MIRLLAFLFFLTLMGCKKDFTNKHTYSLKVGERFEYYVSSNSCCPNCFLNQHSMTSIRFLESKEVSSAPGDCDGCTTWFAYVFEAVKSGQDTIKIFNINPCDTCSVAVLNKYKEKPVFSIVAVKE